jgi:MFS transporter, DHA2 family, methylenomycin A resistance protein
VLDVQAPDSAARLRRAALLTVVVGQFAVQLASMPISAILPTLADAFHADFALISWVSGAYLLTLTGFLLVAGRLGDLYGHRRVYMVGIVIYSVAGGLGGLAPDALFLIVLRGLQGLGSALMLGNGLAIIANAFPGGERGRAVGIVQIAASLGGVAGLVYSALFLDTLSWQWLFWVLWPIGLLGLWSARHLDDGVRRDAAVPIRPDVLGAGLLFLTLTVGTLSLNHLHGGAHSFQEGAAYHTTMQIIALLLLGAFIFVERRSDQPLVRFGDLRNRDFNALAVCNTIMHMTMMAAIFTMPFLLERALELPKSYTGVLLTVLQLTWVGLAYLSGYLYDRYRATWLVPVGMALIALGLLGWGLLAPLGYGMIMVAAIVMGVGTGLYMTANNTLAIGLLPGNKRGLASGVLETSRQLGHTLGVAVAGTMMGAAVADALSGVGTAAGFLVGFQQISLAMAALCGIGLGLSLLPLLPRGPAAPRPAATAAPVAGGQR